MELIYTFFISFSLVFLSELGDKTQLLVLSFSTKDRAKNILLGVALGTLFSHGLAIIFGSRLALLGNDNFRFYLELFTYISFLLFGILLYNSIIILSFSSLRYFEITSFNSLTNINL